jgi:transcriptional regulator with XRE-family HTH domain
MRRIARLDRRALAAAARVHPATVAIIEHGQRENPPLVLLASFSRALKVSIAALTDPFILRLGRITGEVHPGAINPPPPPNMVPIDTHDPTGPTGMGRMLRTLRSEQGLSITRAAALSGLSGNHISSLERALTENPGLLTLTQLARVISGDGSLPTVAECVALATQIFAQELTSFEALRRYRANGRLIPTPPAATLSAASM